MDTFRVSHALVAAFAVVLAALPMSASARPAAPCPAGMRCGRVTVPLDRRNPSAGTIEIRYALVPHTEKTRAAAGTIVPNPGGPGQATIGSAPLYIQAMRPLLRDRDLLLIDARGTGQSGALRCPSLTSRDPLSLDVTIIGRICGARLGKRAGLYGSAAVADDIDAVRAALRLDKLDLFGDSYGTFLMPVYAARHPKLVRSIVLDGAFPIASDPWAGTCYAACGASSGWSARARSAARALACSPRSRSWRPGCDASRCASPPTARSGRCG